MMQKIGSGFTWFLLSEKKWTNIKFSQNLLELCKIFCLFQKKLIRTYSLSKIFEYFLLLSFNLMIYFIIICFNIILNLDRKLIDEKILSSPIKLIDRSVFDEVRWDFLTAPRQNSSIDEFTMRFEQLNLIEPHRNSYFDEFRWGWWDSTDWNSSKLIVR